MKIPTKAKKEKISNLYVFFGPPGAGKSTQAIFLEKRLGFFYVSWGRIWREIKSGIGDYSHYRKEKFVQLIIKDPTGCFPAGFIKNIIKKEIKKIIRENPSQDRNIVLDGFPRRIQEAKELLGIIKECKLCLKAIIRFNASLDTVRKRIGNRLYCPKCHKFYNEFIQPQKRGICDIDRNKLIKRPDDVLETNQERYNQYIEESLNAFNFLIPKSDAFFDVNADQDSNMLFAEIMGKIFGHFRKQFQLFKRISRAEIETSFGKFIILGYQNSIDYSYHLALIKGKVSGKRNVLTRIHSSCVTGDIFFSKKCDCGEQLKKSFEIINQRGSGIIIYLFQEGRGINILNKIKAYKLQSFGLNTFEANEQLNFPSDLRTYEIVKDILYDLKVKSIDILTNNPDKLYQLQNYGIIIENRVPLIINPNKFDASYLETKRRESKHIIPKIKTQKKLKSGQNNHELEIKFLFNEKQTKLLKEKILAIPDTFYRGKNYEKTTMFDTPDGLLAKEDARLRIRQISREKDSDDQKIEFSYKRRIKATGGIKKEEEIESEFQTDILNLTAILKRMNYAPISSYERFRETYWHGNSLKITLDEFPFGYILEIEGEKKEIQMFCKWLNLKQSQSYALSCDDAYVDLCKKAHIVPKDHILFSDKDMPQIK
jgi:GTP cyclohydrolase II